MHIHAVLPTYNRGHLLARSVDSFLAAEAPDGVPTVLFIVDNNSKDDTGHIARDYAARHPGRIHAVFEGQQGRHHALNAGIAYSNSRPGADPADVIAFFDDDELLDPHWLRVLARNFADPAVDYVGGEMRPDWEAPPPDWFPKGFNGVVGIVRNGEVRRQYGAPGFEAMLVGGNAAIRRSVLARCGPYSPDFMYAEDRYMNMQLDRVGAVGFYDPDLVVLHSVPKKRMNKAYYRHWVFTEGRTHARAAQEAPPPGRTLLGAPLWRWRRAAGAAATWLTRRHAPERFAAELRIVEFWGFVSHRVVRARYKDRSGFQ